MYVAVLLICVGLLVFFSMPLWADISDGQPDIYHLVAAAGVGAYSARQLLRPTPRSARVPSAD